MGPNRITMDLLERARDSIQKRLYLDEYSSLDCIANIEGNQVKVRPIANPQIINVNPIGKAFESRMKPSVFYFAYELGNHVLNREEVSVVLGLHYNEFYPNIELQAMLTAATSGFTISDSYVFSMVNKIEYRNKILVPVQYYKTVSVVKDKG